MTDRQSDRLQDLAIPEEERTAGRAPGRGRPLVALLLALIGAAVAVFTLHRAESEPASNGPATAETQEPPPLPRSSMLEASGYVVARRQATVSSKVTGKVAEVFVEEGMEVEEGQILARLDGALVRRELALAEAELASASSAVEEVEVRLDQAELTRQRTERLVSDGILSRAELDTARADADSLRAHLANSRDRVLVAERAVDLQKQRLEDTVIRAPFDGVAISKDAQPGEMISPVSAGGSFTRTGVSTVVDMDSLEIEVDVNESYINRVHAGQPVHAVLDAYPDWQIPCLVITTVPAADRQKATVKVRIALHESDLRILPDMGVRVVFLERDDPPTG